MSTVAQLKDRIFRGTNELYNNTHHMLDLINDGVNILIDAGKLRKKTTISAVVGTANYALPADFKAPGILQDETNDNYVIPYDLVDISENGYGYAIEAGYIYLKPSPLEDKVLTHYYYNYAVTLTLDTETPTEIDAQYHNLIALYAISMIVPLIPTFSLGMQDRALKMWTDGLNGFVKANTKKNKNTRSREKVVW